MSAIISECGQYRYRLDRKVRLAGPVIAFFGVNPSTADASLDDATTRKWWGFSERMGARAYIAGNLFAYRATDVRQLAAVDNPVGYANGDYLAAIIKEANILVPCWGNLKKLRRVPEFALQVQRVSAMLRQSGKPCLCFGLTKEGDPKHPLFIGYDTKLIPWRGY